MTDRTQKVKDRKNEQRRKHAEQARKNRVLIEYIEKTHPQIHNDACEYYEELKQKYPNKLDLRRTVEFEITCHNTSKRRRTQKQKEPGKTRDNMVLTIPLIPQFVINQPQSDQTTPPQSDQTIPPQSDQTIPPQSDQTTPPQPDNMPQHQPDNMPQHQPDNMPQHQPDNMPQHQPDNIPLPFPALTNEMVDEIIRDLQQTNPGFEQWFEDIDTDLDIDIDSEGITPLEVELS